MHNVRPSIRPLLHPIRHNNHRLLKHRHQHPYQPIHQYNRHTHLRTLLTLAIETSCDDTAVAILEKDTQHGNPATPSPNSSQTILPLPLPLPPKARLLFNEKVTAPNTGLGGIHPIQALESHQANLAILVRRAIGFLPTVTSSSSSSPSSTTGQARANGTDTDTDTNTGRQKVNAINHHDGTTKQLPDFVSVTRGPGMRSNLHCGLDTARGLAVAWGVPLVGVHHMQAHALTPRLVRALQADDPSEQSREANVEFPFLTLLVSGGHTMLLHSTGLTDHKILATTADVAIGDALDKSGRMILPQHLKLAAKDTAFAKHLSDFAFPGSESYHLWPVPQRRMHEINKPKNQFGWQIQAPFADTKQMAFSFTSIPSTVEHILQKRAGSLEGDLEPEEREVLGRTAIGTAFEHLASRTVIALESLQSAKQNVSTLVVSGGVAANPFLRFFLRAMLDTRGFDLVKLVFPPPWLCTDNAAMIAWCGMEMYEAGYCSELGIDARRKWSMDSGAPDGGILGVGGWRNVDDSQSIAD